MTARPPSRAAAALAAAVAALAVLSAAAPAAAGPADPDSLIWVSKEAAADSLARYWKSLDRSWYEPLTPEDLDLGLSPAQYDSMVAVGDSLLAAMAAGRPWRISVGPALPLRFNRVEGLSPGVRAVIDRPGPRQPRFDLDAEYGFAWKRASYGGAASLPLATARRRDASGALLAEPWTRLGLEAAAGRRTEWFAGDMRPERNLAALLYGKDPNQYYLKRGWQAALRFRPRPAWTLLLGGGAGTDEPLVRHTTWSLFGDRADVGDNLPVTPLHRRSLFAGMRWRRGGLRLEGRHVWHRVDDEHFMPNVPGPQIKWYRLWSARAEWQGLDRWGDTWTLRGAWHDADRQTPPQWKTYLGDLGTLRGYDAMTLTGDRGGWAALDVRWNVDPLGALHVPLIGRWGLQPVTFVEAGRALNRTGPYAPLGETGTRYDAGLGLSKYLGLGGSATFVRLYAARPFGAGQKGAPWRWSLAFEVR